MGYYLRRVFQAVVTFVAGMFPTYSLFRLIPGGPLEAMVSQRIARAVERGEQPNSEEIAEDIQELTGINPETGPVEGFIQYASDIVFRQDFGQSLFYGEPVFDKLFEAMPWSMFISVYGLIFGFTATIFVGVVMAWFEGTKIDSGLTVFVLILNSIPYYVGAVVMLVVLGFYWGLFPTGGRMDPATTPGLNLPFIFGILHHAALPIISGFVVGFAGGSLGMRGNTIRIMGSDYLRSARLRGVSTNRILSRYLTRNAVLPIYTGLMIGIAGIFSSNVVSEYIFQYPGVGWLLLRALNNQDYPMIMGGFIFFAGLTVIGIMIADLTYPLIDPRAKSGADREVY
jgi:peptide/nickel transport system permease protein